MLTGAGFRNQAIFAQPFRQQGLSQNVINFVAAGVIKVLTLQENTRTTAMLTKTLRFGDDRRPSGVRLV